jgi:hypothetical protein
MSKYKITKKRLAEIIKEEYASILEQKLANRQDESSCGTGAANREEKKPDDDGDGVPNWADKKPGKDDHADEDETTNESAGDWTKAIMTGDARDAYGVQKTKSGKSDDSDDDKDDKKKKKMKKESLDSIRTLIQQELKNI